MRDNKYCYPNTNVLKNKLGIKNPQKIFDVEKRMTMLRIRELQSNPIQGDFDFDHLKAIHKYIFQDMYEWAGQMATMSMPNQRYMIKYIKKKSKKWMQKK